MYKRQLSERERDEEIRKLEKQMQEASRMLEFEYAAILRDRIIELRKDCLLYTSYYPLLLC